ncbi:helix-turn-helix domain-containing protein [Pandoraea anhela]|uniref:Helix-hairpin-helix DNA-binding motif-containing protein n=1 Tax=Pandoraea anhela TaxID=2508295 RepID=A0A5E4SE01_9BURK|nr:helix-turn-helix domain-containing protein [Pandoraea anhela]VVD73391.1 helix-hairpin-helix DNA-binding motif-containing protein [Pandoraea anhela]
MQTNPLALFGDHLARLRKARGWSQEKLALESGLARSYVSGIERGRRNVALVNICVLADTLGVPTSEMLRFAQASAGAEDASAQSGRTPLPQISRSLCKLENRDQVWLAEIIRSLSSRLSHAAPPATIDTTDTSNTTNTSNAIDTAGTYVQTSADAQAGEADATASDREDDAEDVCAINNTDNANEAAALSRPSLEGGPARVPSPPGFDARYRAQHRLTPPAQTRYDAADAVHDAPATSASVEASSAAGKPSSIGDPMDDRQTASGVARPSASDRISREGSLRLPGNDET